jgi:phage tail-like protein
MPDIDARSLFTTFNFAVEIQLPDVQGVAQPLCDAAFSECDGLEISFDVKTIREGGNNARQIRLTGGTTLGQLTLKRGMTRRFDLWTWVTQVQRNPGLRADATVVMFGSQQGQPADSDREDLRGPGDERVVRARFALSRCLPVKLKAPALNAKDGLLAVEELQVAYEALELVEIRGANATR